MTDEQDLTRQLNRPAPPPDLVDKIHANWRQQIAQQQAARPLRWAVVAGLALMALLLTPLLKSPAPDLVSAAISDIVNDDKQQVGMTLTLDEVLQASHLQPPPPSMAVAMSKYCQLNGNKTTHLKIAGAKQGYVHLFIRQGNFEATGWQADDRSSSPMPWRLLKPRKDLTVLVLYTRDMNPASVDTLLQTMFSV